MIVMATPKTKLPKKIKSELDLSKKLFLNRWIFSLFNIDILDLNNDPFDRLSEHLKDQSLEGIDSEGRHYFYSALLAHFPNLTELPVELLERYERNIVLHTKRINESRNKQGFSPIHWKYFQWLTLLFTEIYLDRYFSNPEKLLSDLNAVYEKFNTILPDADKIKESFSIEQLNKISFWNATGSGKTLLMHVHLLQFLQYHNQKGKSHALNRIILLTPNEGLSKQHLEEFKTSGIDAELFDKNARNLFTGKSIEIIDINKIKDESGDKTVAVEAFEGNNLVFVDEGHRGTSSGGDGTWLEFRNRLCEEGFSFEYSATFGQAIGTDAKLTSLYSKNVLFDYSYRYFYKDGFGKDYQIFNIDTPTETASSAHELYLTGALLSFYEQKKVFSERNSSFQKYNIENPLWIFVGGSVSASLSKDDQTDIMKIISFLSRFISDKKTHIKNIKRLLVEGFKIDGGEDLFNSKFRYILEQIITSLNDEDWKCPKLS